MKYSIQNGVVREVICGQNILISTKEARKTCPYLTQLNEASVFVWKMLEDGKDTEDMKAEIVQEYQVSIEEAEEAMMEFLNGMEEQHFIVKEGL